MKCGLTLGKYAPLHRGHQWVIETAIAEMDTVIVVIYDSPDVTDIPLSVRAGWLRALYPTIQVIEAWDGPTIVGDTPEIRALHEAYLHSILGETPITHFYSSEFYGDHVSAAFGAVDRRVDPDRLRYPVSGTAVRSAPYAHRQWVDPLVYRDLITTAVFVGAPSTGKTTLAETLAARHGTVWMPEYGREYWETHQIDRRLTPDQLVEIARTHRAREDRLLLEADRLLFSDTNALTTAMFARDYHGFVPPELITLADDSVGRADLIFLCADDIPYDNTWDRSGVVHRARFQKQIRADLIARRIPFVTLRGDLETRVSTVNALLRRFRKYHSLADTLL